MPKFKDLTGKRFGRWVVLQRSSRTAKLTYWDCACDCGTKRVVSGGLMVSGHSKSCGCLQREVVTKRNLKHGHNFRVGGKPTTEYTTWCGMWQRCTKPNSISYKNYGARGVSVCPQWQDFRVFLADMGLKPDKRLTIDRIDNKGNYEPGNCRWATRSEQQKNK